MSDFIAAFCVGVGQVTIGHPFDTTKILIQNKNHRAKIEFDLTLAFRKNISYTETFHFKMWDSNVWTTITVIIWLKVDL